MAFNIIIEDDRLVDRDCAALDGKCNCPRNLNGGVPDTCKYLPTMDQPLGPVSFKDSKPKEFKEDF